MINFLTGLVIGAVAGSVITFLITRRSQVTEQSPTTDDFARLMGDPGNKPQPNAFTPVALEQDLRAKCMHDADLMERLIQAENDRRPASREENVKAAIERWERHNH